MWISTFALVMVYVVILASYCYKQCDMVIFAINLKRQEEWTSEFPYFSTVGYFNWSCP